MSAADGGRIAVARTAWRRAGALASTGGLQVLVQGLAFATGLLVVRALEPVEYAYYTIAYTALGAMAAISDSGVANGVLSAGGRVWTDRAALGGVLAAGLELRRRLALVVAALAVPAVAALLWHQGASPWLAAGLACAVLPLFLATLTTGLLEVVPRLHQDLVPLQATHATAHAARLALLAGSLALLPFAATALLVAALPQWWANRRIGASTVRHALPSAAPGDATRAELWRCVRRTLPFTLYYALSSQLTVLLVALLGSAKQVAAVGALGRLAMVLTVVGNVFALVVVPRFARLAADTGRVRARYWQAQALLVAFVLAPAAVVLVAPGPVLAVLGPSYAGFTSEAVLFAASSAAAALAGAAFSLGTARGVIAPPRLAIPLCIVAQAVSIVVLPVETVAGAIWVALLAALVQWAVHVAYFEWRLRRTGAGGPA